MDTTLPQQDAKKSKVKVKPSGGALRVKLETRKRVLTEVVKANKKDFGRKVKVDDLIALAISLVEPRHIKELQEATLSNQDRFEREYKAYIAKYGPISKDAYLGKRLDGQIETDIVSPHTGGK